MSKKSSVTISRNKNLENFFKLCSLLRRKEYTDEEAKELPELMKSPVGLMLAAEQELVKLQSIIDSVNEHMEEIVVGVEQALWALNEGNEDNATQLQIPIHTPSPVKGDDPTTDSKTPPNSYYPTLPPGTWVDGIFVPA